MTDKLTSFALSVRQGGRASLPNPAPPIMPPRAPPGPNIPCGCNCGSLLSRYMCLQHIAEYGTTRGNPVLKHCQYMLHIGADSALVLVSVSAPQQQPCTHVYMRTHCMILWRLMQTTLGQSSTQVNFSNGLQPTSQQCAVSA